MARLRRLRTFEVVRILEQHGFVYDQHNGSHIIMVRLADELRLPVPDRRNRPLPVGTLNAIIRETGIPRSEFE